MIEDHSEATRMAQDIKACNFVDLYWEIKRSSEPRAAVAQSIVDVSQARLVYFLIKLLETWYQHQQQLESANDYLDVGE